MIADVQPINKSTINQSPKIYAIDLGLVNVISNNMTEDLGRKLENLVFLHLRRKYTELYYFDEKGECDFVAMKNGNVLDLVQVCYELSPDNLKRELIGLLQAMRYFNQKKATLVTFSDTDFIKKEDYEIEVVPAFRFMIV